MLLCRRRSRCPIVSDVLIDAPSCNHPPTPTAQIFPFSILQNRNKPLKVLLTTVAAGQLWGADGRWAGGAQTESWADGAALTHKMLNSKVAPPVNLMNSELHTLPFLLGFSPVLVQTPFQ